MTSWAPLVGSAGKPRFPWIADATERDQKRGILSAGERLPVQRRPADALGFGFTTASRAQPEAQSRGLIESRVGRGTFVRARPGVTVPLTDPRARGQDLAINQPPEPDDPALLAATRQGGGCGRGQPRAALALPVHRGVRDYRSAARAGLGLVGLPIDGAGILSDAMAEAIRRLRPRALYLNPPLHNPTPCRSRRRGAWTSPMSRSVTARRWSGMTPTASSSPTPRRHLPPWCRNWHGTSADWPSALGLAFTVAPDRRSAVQLAEALRVANVMASPLMMALASRWIEGSTADRICRFIRAESAARQDIAVRLPQGFVVRADRHAFTVWLKGPDGVGGAWVMGCMNGRGSGLMLSDAFAVLGPADKNGRIRHGGSITRKGLRAGLSDLVGNQSAEAWLGQQRRRSLGREGAGRGGPGEAAAPSG